MWARTPNFRGQAIGYEFPQALPSRIMVSCLFAECCVLRFFAAAVSVQSQSSQGIAPAVTQFDPQPWIDDFHELTSAMASHYADLDWAIRDRGMNLPKLRQDTEEKLRHSGDEQSARDAMQEFLDAFGDGHLSIEWEKPDASRNAATSKASKSLCGRLNYKMNLNRA